MTTELMQVHVQKRNSQGLPVTIKSHRKVPLKIYEFKT